MRQVRAEGIVAPTAMPMVLREFAREVRRNKVTDEQEFNVFATRYFAKLAGVSVAGYPDLPDRDRHTIHVYRPPPPAQPEPKVDDEEEHRKNKAAKPEERPTLPSSNSFDLAGGGDGMFNFLAPSLPSVSEALSRFLARGDEAIQLERAVFDEIAAVRANPAAYADKIAALQAFYHEPSGTFAVPGGVVLSSAEGFTAYSECIEQLRATQPLPPLKHSLALALASCDGLAPGMEAVPPRELCQRYGTFSEELGSSVAQSLCFNQVLPQILVIHLLVDDNYSSRGNRTNLLADEYHHVGICFADATCNVILASNYSPLAECEGAQYEASAEHEYGLVLDNEHFRALDIAEVLAALQADPLYEPPEPAENAVTVTSTVDDQPVELVPLRPPELQVEATEADCIAVLRHSGGRLTASLASIDDPPRSVADRGCLAQSRNGHAAIRYHLPGPGTYQLGVSVDMLGNGVYTQVFVYRITAADGVAVAPEPQRFPTTFVQSHSCYLHTPWTGSLKSGFVPFVVETFAPTIGIAVLCGEEMYYLQQQQPNIWCGSVLLRPGTCKVSMNIDQTHYEVFGFSVHE
eukprot:TRINITY_DN10344_c0_g1_i1.p1 TRINITY_DN10344_c0_g1~~TRINITY_DN10344_c0_g1_i1.p1  ORF type:complete len:576 (+),score=108.32 TRINITY_DN10344_c0_g1_i1:41-1768(+)